MTPSPTFDRVYIAIRERLLEGYWLPGQRIDLPKLADDLVASMTPVRDALNRLTGERLIVPGTSEGFAMPPMTEPELRDLYDWHHQLLMLALRDRSGTRLAMSGPPSAPHEAVTSLPALSAAITARVNNVEIRKALEGVAARLGPAHIIEQQLIAGAVDVDRISRDWIDADRPALRSGLTAWHRHRLQAAGRIVYLLHRAAGST